MVDYASEYGVRQVEGSGRARQQFVAHLAWLGLACVLGAGACSETPPRAADRRDDTLGRIALAAGASWDPVVTSKMLVPADATESDLFGDAVSVDGNTVAVGAPFHSGAAVKSGAVYVYVRADQGWELQQKLTAPGAVGYEWFGWSVGLSGDRLVVGAPRTNLAYAFERSGSTWSLETKLEPDDGSASDEFGHAVAVSGSTAVVGAYQQDDNETDAGAVYVFVRGTSGWAQKNKLQATVPISSEQLGYAVAIDGDTILAGAVGAAVPDEPWRPYAGAAYVFVREGASWEQQQRIQVSGATESDFFGVSVAVSGDRAAVGASYYQGNVYAFGRDKGSWVQEDKFGPYSAESESAISVGLDGPLIALGNAATAYFGQVKIQQEDAADWTELDSFVSLHSGYGQAVAIDRNVVVVGAPYGGKPNETGDGAAFVYTLLAPDGASCPAVFPCQHGSCPAGICGASAPDAGAVADAEADSQSAEDAAAGNDAQPAGDATMAADAGPADAGPADASVVDAGAGTDAGPADARVPEAGVDGAAGKADSGGDDSGGDSGGCRLKPARSTPWTASALLAALVLLLWRRRHGGARCRPTRT